MASWMVADAERGQLVDGGAVGAAMLRLTMPSSYMLTFPFALSAASSRGYTRRALPS
jgi:hypothetical protein